MRCTESADHREATAASTRTAKLIRRRSADLLCAPFELTCNAAWPGKKYVRD